MDGPCGFGGVDDHYFLSAALPKTQPVRLQYQPVPVHGRGIGSVDSSSCRGRCTFANPPAGERFFFGPKDFDVLRSRRFAISCAPSISASSTGSSRRCCVRLKWVNGYIGNYGWSIIVLTILINLAMFPLRHKSVVSMRKMQELQPEVKAIQDRYAKLKMSDPARQKMNVELMNLYRERGVNPASGCVPMLLTMPVLFAFYAMLSVAIELRGAPFMGWIQRPLHLRSAVHHARRDGRHAVRPDEDGAGDRRSDAAEDDALHAAHLHDDAHLGAKRAGAVLDGEQPVGDRAAGRHESPDWARAGSASFVRRPSAA